MPEQCIPPRALHGYGAFLRMWDVAAEEWLVLGGTKDLEIPKLSREKVKTNDDDGDGTMHYIGSPQTDLGDVTFEMDFIVAQHRMLHAIVQQSGVYYTEWQVVLNTPQQDYYEWCGFPGELGAAVPKEDLVTTSLMISSTGGGLRDGKLVTE